MEQYNPERKCKVLIVFDDMIAGIISNKNLNQKVTELFVWGKKLKTSTDFYHTILFCNTKRC